ncbi:amidase family protein [Patulibacter sp. NPDC049589]|uniref:amidase family protein n=1 Tax=Patulibacter sp. NPDC049589 TaxID=3154731 RepID=UPI00343F8251
MPQSSAITPDPAGDATSTERAAAPDGPGGTGFAPRDAGAVLAAVRRGVADVTELARAARDRAAAQDDPSFLHVVDDATLDGFVVQAEAAGPQAALAGLTFAVKDNIDVAGAPTTAACPSYAFVPERSATVVEQLIAHGAVPVGKTNLDQFATGLVGTRSPYGAPRSVHDPSRVSGGSSSGSAVAVARGDVDFALGTDTAGSGRVPAAFNGLVGLKPTLGRLSTAGVVPACRSLDCVSVFTRDVDTAATVLEALTRSTGPAPYPGGPTDPADPSSRGRPGGADAAAARLGGGAGGAVGGGTVAGTTTEARGTAGGVTTVGGARVTEAPRPWRVGVDRDALVLAGDDQTRAAWAAAITALEDRDDVEVVPVDLEPFVAAGKLLYEGPWVAERYAAVGAFLETGPADADPTVAGIVLSGREPRAVEAFEAGYRLQALRVTTHATLATVDALLAPTAPIHPTVAEVEADPVGVNTQLGRFTNFVNLLDLCALAVPGPPRPDGLPFGVTLLAPAWHDELLLEFGATWERSLGGGGATSAGGGATSAGGGGEAVHDVGVVGDDVGSAGRATAGAVAGPTRGTVVPPATPTDGSGRVEVVVAGAHMAGLPANPQLLDRGATFVRQTRTASGHGIRIVQTPMGVRPGLARPVAGSAAPEGSAGQVEVEVWSVDAALLGSLAGEVPEGLALGPVALLDGTRRLGFVAAAVDPAAPTAPIPGGWRRHLADAAGA